MSEHNRPNAAIIGAGPAGLFAAKELAKNGAFVVLINRDIKPGGLAEYGIYPDKIKTKDGLRKQFASCLELQEVSYYGNVLVGQNGDLRLEDIRRMGFDAILVTTGAQGTKWQGLPGENLPGVYHAKDIVYHYNLLPPYSTREFRIGKNVVIIGVGSVMMDVARYLIQEKHADCVTAIARRGPAEVKFTCKELEYLADNFDLHAYQMELKRVTQFMRAVGQDPTESLKFVLDALQGHAESHPTARFQLKFLSSLRRIVADEHGNVVGIEIESNQLVLKEGTTAARGLGTYSTVPCDTVIFAIGDSVDPGFGLPVENNEYVKNPSPVSPVDGVSYECFDPAANRPVDGVFLAGWARKASTGLVGVARKDGINAAHAILNYLAAKNRPHPADICDIQKKLCSLCPHCVSKEDVLNLCAEEKRIAEERGVETFKFAANTEMLAAIKKKTPA
jgi:ferredoxin--NADP+ reductase